MQEEAFQRALRESRNNFAHDPKHEPQLAGSEWLQLDAMCTRSGSSSANGYRGPPRITTDKKCRAQKRGKEQQWVHLVDEVDRAASIPLPSVLGPVRLLVRAWKALRRPWEGRPWKGPALEGAWEVLEPGGPGTIFLLLAKNHRTPGLKPGRGCACVHQSTNG